MHHLCLLYLHISEEVSVSFFDPTEAVALWDWKDGVLFNYRVKLWIVDVHSRGVLTFEIDLVAGPVRLLGFRSQSEGRRGSLVRLGLSVVSFSEPWHFIVSRACHVKVHGHDLLWGGWTLFLECVFDRDRECASSTTYVQRAYWRLSALRRIYHAWASLLVVWWPLCNVLLGPCVSCGMSVTVLLTFRSAYWGDVAIFTRTMGS